MKLDLNKIQEIYGDSSIYEIKNHMDQVVDNMNYLLSLGFNDVYNIVENDPYMFLYDKKEFINKIDKLINKLGVEYIEKLEEDFSLWGEIYD